MKEKERASKTERKTMTKEERKAEADKIKEEKKALMKEITIESQMFYINWQRMDIW